MDFRLRVLAVTAGMAVAWAAGSAGAEEAKVTVVNVPSTSKVTVINAGNVLSAMKVARDKETGKLRPATPEEAAQMGRASTPGYAPSIVVQSHPMTSMVTHADGSITLRRSLDDLDKLVISRDRDGQLEMGHGAKAASRDASKPTE